MSDTQVKNLSSKLLSGDKMNNFFGNIRVGSGFVISVEIYQPSRFMVACGDAV
jgi:hypothetical protein